MAEELQSEQQFVVFILGEEEYGLPISNVQEINRITEITKVPKAIDTMEGIINLRGKVIPVISLRRQFQVSGQNKQSEDFIVVVEIQGQTIGLIVDGVSEVLKISSQLIEAPPTMVGNSSGEFVGGIAKVSKRLIILLDLAKLFSLDEINQLERIA